MLSAPCPPRGCPVCRLSSGGLAWCACLIRLPVPGRSGCTAVILLPSFARLAGPLARVPHATLTAAFPGFTSLVSHATLTADVSEFACLVVRRPILCAPPDPELPRLVVLSLVNLRYITVHRCCSAGLLVRPTRPRAAARLHFRTEGKAVREGRP